MTTKPPCSAWTIRVSGEPCGRLTATRLVTLITGEQIRMARAGLRLSVRALAKIAGVSAMTVTRLENGRSGGYALDITGFHDIEEHASGAEIFLSIPLGDRTQAQVSTRVGAGKPQAEVTVTSPANPDGGFGYSASATSGPSDGAEGSAYWTGQRISADVSL